MEQEYREALRICGTRYMEMIYDAVTSTWTHAYNPEDHPLVKLDMFIQQFQLGIRDLPLMKLNRWLGYIQGCLIERGYTTVKAERDFTRPLFKHLDFPNDR